jgi:hypothetical protein
MIIIKFFSSFGSNEGAIEAYTRVSELLKDPLFNVKYRFTLGEDYTHAIILNTAMPVLSLPKANVIGLAFEPNLNGPAFEPLKFLGLTTKFVDYAQKHIGTYLIGEKINLPPPFVEHFGFMWHTTPLTEVPIKNKIISLMISKRTITTGHKYRHILCDEILKSNLPIDIYGNGCHYHQSDERLKGQFEGKEPYLNYLFHIAIENQQTPHYFSEKIMDPLLCHTTPVYLGCQNIDTYFPESVLHLTGNITQDMQLLLDICLNPTKYIKPIDVEKIKQTISFTNIVKKYWL